MSTPASSVPCEVFVVLSGGTGEGGRVRGLYDDVETAKTVIATLARRERFRCWSPGRNLLRRARSGNGAARAKYDRRIALTWSGIIAGWSYQTATGESSHDFWWVERHLIHLTRRQ